VEEQLNRNEILELVRQEAGLGQVRRQVNALQAALSTNGAALVKAGMIGWTAASDAPEGWLVRDGSVHARDDYPDLFNAIGTTFNTGGETGTQFRVPDDIGKYARGSATPGNSSATSVTSAPTDSGGVADLGEIAQEWDGVSGFVEAAKALHYHIEDPPHTDYLPIIKT
jgi:hypothetical protein